jgi:hypothetical protein
MKEAIWQIIQHWVNLKNMPKSLDKKYLLSTTRWWCFGYITAQFDSDKINNRQYEYLLNVASRLLANN